VVVNIIKREKVGLRSALIELCANSAAIFQAMQCRNGNNKIMAEILHLLYLN
jgi:hypothetical protein